MEAAMKLLLFVLGIGVAVFGIGTRAEAKTIHGVRCTTAGRMAAGQIAVSQALNSAWPPRAGSAAIVS